MIIDKENLFSDAQTVTTGSENGVMSTNVIDLGSARHIGVGENLYVVVAVTTLMAGAGDTCTPRLVTDDNAGFNSPTVLATIGTFAANSAAGSRLILRLPPGTYERYLGVQYLADGSGPLEAGAFDAFLTHDIDAFTAYAKGYTIS